MTSFKMTQREDKGKHSVQEIKTMQRHQQLKTCSAVKHWISVACKTVLAHLSYKTRRRKKSSSERQIGVFFNGLGVWSWLIYTICKFINARCGTGCNFPRWSPTLSGLMSVLSMPVLTMSLSRLQFLLAIATRLPFWPGPADLKCRVTLFGLDQPSESKIFKIYPDQVVWHVCLQNTHPHNEGIWTCIST